MEESHLEVSRKNALENTSIEMFEKIEFETDELLKAGNSQEVSRYLRNILALKENSSHTPEALLSASRLVDKISKKALSYINDPHTSLLILRSAKIILSQYPNILISERCNLLNNLACTYRRLGKLHSAKKYLDQALEILKYNRQAEIDKASTHLNCCAVFSNLNRHREALDHAMVAVQYAQDDMINIISDAPGPDIIHKISVLSISYYNIAVENEYLKRFDEACEWYTKAIKFLQKHQENKNLKEILDTCMENYNEIKDSSTSRVLQRPFSTNENSRLRPVSAKSATSSASRKIVAREQAYKPPLKHPKPIPIKTTLQAAPFDARFPLEGKQITFDQLKAKIEYEKKFKIPNINDKNPKNLFDSKTEKKIKAIFTTDESRKAFKERPKSSKPNDRIINSPYRPSMIKTNMSFENNPVKSRISSMINSSPARTKSSPLKENESRHRIVIEEQKNVREKISKPIRHDITLGLEFESFSNITLNDSHNTEISLPKSYSRNEINKDELLKQSVVKIQALFRGKRDRLLAKLYKKSAEKSKYIYKTGRRIGGEYYMILIMKAEYDYKLSVTKIGEIDKVSEFSISSSQAENPDELISHLQVDECGKLYIGLNTNNYFEHIHRAAKNVSGKDLVIDCYSSRSGDSMLLKAKDMRTSKNFSLKVAKQTPRSPSKITRQLKESIIPNLIIHKEDLEFYDAASLPKQNHFNLLLARPVLLNSEKRQMTIFTSPNHLKIICENNDKQEEIIIEKDEIAKILNIEKKDIEANAEKLLEMIEKNNDLTFLTANTALETKASEEKIPHQFEGFVLEDKPMGLSAVPENAPTKFIKSLWRNLDGINYLLEAIQEDEFILLKATYVNDKSKLISKQYSKAEIHENYGTSVMLEELLNTLQVKNGEIYLKFENNSVQETTDVLLYLTTRYIDDKDFLIKIILERNLENPSDSDTIRIELFQKKSFFNKCYVGLKEVSDILCLSYENLKDIAIYIAWSMLKLDGQNIQINKDAPHYDLERCATMIQSLFKGYLIRSIFSPLLKKAGSPATVKKNMVITGDNLTYSVEIIQYPKFIFIQATNKQLSLKLFLKIEILNGYPDDFGPKDIIEQHIIPRLHISLKNGQKELHGIKDFEMIMSK
ncbi:unnamed protein product [Blepharisma stoltei]|uniref:Uncharacterized protein n=1 Tax=Blepharisma stoltei TaxID=1481888 RepID=A0AAU9IBF3_9CILI|nr:unnamed protein product [Blepharisma stoltei]